MEYILGLADEAALEQIYRLIDQRIRWMDENDIRQWNVTDYWNAYPKDYYVREMRRGRLYVLKLKADQRVAGAVVLLEQDSRWKDAPLLPAYYIHNFVAGEAEHGAGGVMLQKIQELAVKNRKVCLRLDCAVSNRKLNCYYERKGFLLAGQCVDGNYSGNRREKKLQEM